MRLLILWCLLALAVVARAEDGGTVSVAPEEDLDLLETLDEDTRVDIARALADLFEFNDDDDIEHDEEEGINRESRANEEESALEMKAKIEPEDQARYNKFMDTFFRRLNADARSSIDPLDVALIKKTKKAGTKKGSAKKGSTKKQKGNSKNKSGSKKNNKKSQKKGNNKNKKNKKNKKTARHPKNMNLEEGDEDEGESANEEVAVAEEEVHHIVAREAEEIEEIEEEDEEEEHGLERQERSADAVVEDEDVDESEAAVARRSGKPQRSNKGGKGGKNNKKGGKGGKNNKKGKSKTKSSAKKGKNKSKSKTKRSANKRKNKKKRSTPKTSRAAVSGIATLSRVGDVSVVDRKDGKELRTNFRIGPVNLKVNRKFGSGKNALVQSATASSPELTGKMHLYVAANGKARITKFNIARPSVVTTSGSLNRNQDKRTGNNNFMESSISRIVPAAAKKLKLAARDVLQATESKN